MTKKNGRPIQNSTEADQAMDGAVSVRIGLGIPNPTY